MPKITVNDQTFDAPDGQRLVLAIEDAGISILHRCGGYAKCTTCRVTFTDGEPTQMTEAEKNRLQSEEGLYGRIRLSCQILCENDMTLRPGMTLETSTVSDPGKRPQDSITPDAVWVEKD